MSSAPFELVNIVVRAGAGAGKTTELTERVLKLAENFHASHGRYPHFVVTTFTRKATQELRERLVHKALEKKNQSLLDFVKSPSHLHISTIHGVLSLFLSRFGSAIGLSPRLKIINERSQMFLLKKTLRDLCAKDEALAAAFQTVLEDAEFDDVLSAFLTYFELSLRFGRPPRLNEKEIREGFREQRVALVQEAHTLSEKIFSETEHEAWRELAKLLAQFQEDSDFSQLAEALPSVRKNKTISDLTDEQKKEFIKKLDKMSAWNTTADFAVKHESVTAAFEKIAQALCEKLFQEKIQRAELSMGDLESFSLALIRQAPETAMHFSQKWEYWLVDEYQDTSPAQVELLQSLIGERKSFVVGDPQQSIYLFRGARSEVFTEREKQVQAGGGYCVPKMINYRSRPELLLFFNDLFTGLSSQFSPMEPATEVKDETQKEWDSAIEKEVAQVVILPENKDNLSRKYLEWETAIHRCLELESKGVALEKICVLSRKNDDLEEMALLARKVGLPAQVHAAGQFFDRREVMDALALLKFLINPHDNKNLITLLRSPFGFVRDQELLETLLSKTTTEGSKTSHWLKLSTLSHARLEELQKLLALIPQCGVGQAWFEGLLRLGYFDFSEKIDPTGRREANLWKLVTMIRAQERKPGFQYLEFLKSQGVGELDLESAGEGDAVPVVEPRRVNMMTIHASKGLQFDHVILADMGGRSNIARPDFFNYDEKDGKWSLALPDPIEGTKKTSQFGEKIVDERREREAQELDRQLYVALTRAKQTVTLISSEKPFSASWAARLPLLKTPGLQATDNYSYLVRTGIEGRDVAAEEVFTEQTPALKYHDPKAAKQQLQTLSVTEILERQTQAQLPQNVRKKMSIASVQKAITGVDIHRVFESIKYHALKDPHFTPESLLTELNEKEQTALKYLLKDQNGLWLKLIQDGFVEWGFAVLAEQNGSPRLIQGQIDLWGMDTKAQAWVVDYKTGSPEYLDKAMDQLKIYAWALAKMKKIPTDQMVKLAVIYPLAGLTEIETCRVSDIQI